MSRYVTNALCLHLESSRMKSTYQVHQQVGNDFRIQQDRLYRHVSSALSQDELDKIILDVFSWLNRTWRQPIDPWDG